VAALTSRQREVLEFIRESVRVTGYPPTVREICAELKLSAPSTVHAHLANLLAGNDDPQDIIGSVARGVYAKRFSGGQVNISNGDFVFSLTESYLIEDGKLTAPLRGVNLIGNGPEVLRNVTMVGNDFLLSDGTWTCGKDGQSVPVGIGTPSVKIAQITVGGTKAT